MHCTALIDSIPMIVWKVMWSLTIYYVKNLHCKRVLQVLYEDMGIFESLFFWQMFDFLWGIRKKIMGRKIYKWKGRWCRLSGLLCSFKTNMFAKMLLKLLVEFRASDEIKVELKWRYGERRQGTEFLIAAAPININQPLSTFHTST